LDIGVSSDDDDCIRATGSIKTNLTAVEELGKEWRSQPLIDFAASLSTEISNANAGSLYGNRMFYTNDYMVGLNAGYDGVRMLNPVTI
jgi:hypothetical protein